MSKNTYWSNRVQRLAESESPVSDIKFFNSEAYRSYTEQAAKDMVSGVCDYLRSIGYTISEEQEKHRADDLMVTMTANPDVTACTNGDCITVGSESDVVSYFNSRELRHFAIQGLRVHEIGHVLFTDFPTAENWLRHLSLGRWWPTTPQHANTPEGNELTTRLQDAGFRNIFLNIAMSVENSLEDGYIEREISTMYPGLATRELATVNDALISNAESFSTVIENGGKPFSALMQQVLLYSKFDFMLDDGAEDEYRTMLDECVEEIDAVKYERDAKKRLSGTNEVLCILYPAFKEFIDEALNRPKKKQPQSGSSSQSRQNGKAQGSAGNGQGNAQNSDSQNGSSQNQSQSQGQNQPLTPSEVEKLKGALEKALQDAMKKSGQTQAPQNRNTSSVTQPKSNASKQAKDFGGGKQSSDKAAPRSNNSGVADSQGVNSGKSDLSAAQRDVKSIEENRKMQAAEQKANAEMTSERNTEARKMREEVGANISVSRAETVSESNVSAYNRLSSELLCITKNLERRLKTVIRDEENDDSISGLPMGTRVEARLAYHQDGKIFSRKNFPRDNPRLTVGYLCDESGSMSNDAIEASVRTGIIIQDLCERMELPCYICGFTTSGGDVQILDYVDENVDNKDKYRITGMTSRGGTPTAPAMRYMGVRMKKERTEKKLLIVSTDGCSGNGREVMRQAIKDLNKAGIIVIGAGIGNSRKHIEEEFGKNFLDISDLEKMPRTLCNIVKKNLI